MCLTKKRTNTVWVTVNHQRTRCWEPMTEQKIPSIRWAFVNVYKSGGLGLTCGLNAERGLLTVRLHPFVWMNLTFELVCMTVHNGMGLAQKPVAAQGLSQVGTKWSTNRIRFNLTFCFFHRTEKQQPFITEYLKQNGTKSVNRKPFYAFSQSLKSLMFINREIYMMII